MDAEKLNQELYDKMSAEQDKFRTWLIDQPPADILNHAVEYAVREDILMEMEMLELPDDQVRALLASPDTMSDIYKTFSKMDDTDHMDLVQESIKDRADTLIQNGILSQPAHDRQEAVYLIDRAFLLHMKEVEGGDFEYAVFDKQTKEKTAEGKISGDDVMFGIAPTHGDLAAARDAALEGAGLDGIEVSQVGLTALKDFPRSDIHRRSIWEPDTLPKDDLRFINSSYDEQFRIPNGGVIEVEYPDRIFSARCEYIDDYHAYIGTEVYHMCQFAEILERNGGKCRPEPVLDAERAAWKIGWNAHLTVECGAGCWDYKLFDEQFNATKSGKLEVVGLSINKVRDLILVENKMEHRSMTPTDYGLLMAKVAQKEMDVTQKQPEQTATKPSIKKQLAAKPIPGDKPVQKLKNREVR